MTDAVYIDVNKLHPEELPDPFGNPEGVDYVRLDDVYAMIDNAPIEKVAPIREGHWIIQTDKDGRTYANCSECGAINYAGEINYCYDCGAKMKKVVSE